MSKQNSLVPPDAKGHLPNYFRKTEKTRHRLFCVGSKMQRFELAKSPGLFAQTSALILPNNPGDFPKQTKLFFLPSVLPLFFNLFSWRKAAFLFLKQRNLTVAKRVYILHKYYCRRKSTNNVSISTNACNKRYLL